MHHHVTRRILHGLGANAYGQLVVIVIQLAGVPILLHAWGTQLYGEWLILAAIPTYLSMTDLGFSQSAGNDMTARMARGDIAGALAVFQSLSVLVYGLALAGLVLVALVAAWRKRTATTKARASIAFTASQEHDLKQVRAASSKRVFKLLVSKIGEHLVNPCIAAMMSIPINNLGVIVMRFELPKELIVTAFRRAGIVIKKLGLSPEGQFKSLLETYQVDTVLDVGANVGQHATMLRREA